MQASSARKKTRGELALSLGIVVQHAYGRRVEVIELTVACCPDERNHRDPDDQQRERKDDIENTHGCASSKVRERQDAITTVSELAGIRIAAMSGVSTPRIASAAPITL